MRIYSSYSTMATAALVALAVLLSADTSEAQALGG
jgi:hypothetical protein